MRLQRNFRPALIAVMLIVAASMSCPALASSSIQSQDVEASVLENRELGEPIADSLYSPQPKSPVRAFLLSAAVPGTGEFYSGAKRGALFVATEIAFWAAYFVLHGRAEEMQGDYVSFVDEHIVFEEDSPAKSTKSWTLEDYEHATQSDNWHYVYTETNGQPLDRVGKFYWDDLPEDRIDQPGTDDMVSQSRAEAFEKRHSANDKFKRAKFFLGLVVINHIISAIDGRIAATVYNDRISETGISLHPTISPSGHPGAYLTMYTRF